MPQGVGGSYSYITDYLPSNYRGDGREQYSANQGNYNALREILNNNLNAGLPNRDKLSQYGQSTVNNSFNTADTQLKEQLASKGTYGSGVGLASQIGLKGQRGVALASVENNLNNMEIQQRNQTIMQLLGLTESQSQFEQNYDRLNLQTLGLFESARLGDRSANAQDEASGFNFWRDLLPGLIQGGAAVLTGGASGATGTGQPVQNMPKP